MIIDKISEDLALILNELISHAQLEAENILVIGCSTSEIIGSKIGTNSNIEISAPIVEIILEKLSKNNIFIAAQCCEHLNRALVIEKECAYKNGLEIVSAKPQPKAGGSFATTIYKNLKNPVLVESIKAHAGLDIGDTFVGMHLKHVAVPIRLSLDTLGHAHVTAAKTRPKFIGGERTLY